MSDIDRIEKQIVLKAPLARVWRALTDSQEFGRWFGVALEGAFTPGATIHGRITTPGYEGLPFVAMVERIEPEQLFSYRWHPYAVEPGADYSDEPTTLVVFELSEVAGGTQITVVESGFEGVPLSRRLQALRSNTEGWQIQLGNIERHVLASL